MKESLRININEEKKMQLAILEEFKNICDSNNISYYLGGGTLLGAIRHKGYIPWDDDIDVMLPRKDYEKLLQIFNYECDNEYKLISYKNEKDYYYPFAKIVNLETEIIEKNYKTIKNMGVYIDVFPIDFLPNNKYKINRIIKKYKLLNSLILIHSTKNLEIVTSSKSKLLIKKIILSIIERKRLWKKILKSIDNIAIRYQDTDTVACISGRYFEKEIMPSSYISDYTLVDFEGEKYKAPIGYDAYLKKHYGEYMKLPPKDKQIPDHDNKVYWKEKKKKER